MHLRDLFRDDSTGGWSQTRLWQFIGNLTMTAGFIKVVWGASATEGLAWLFGVYGGIVAGSQIASKLIGLRYGKANGNGKGTNGTPK